MKKEAKEKHTINGKFINDWIKRKELNLRRPFYLRLILFYLGLIITGIFVFCDYRQADIPTVRWIDCECGEDIHIAYSFADFFTDN